MYIYTKLFEYLIFSPFNFMNHMTYNFCKHFYFIIFTLLLSINFSKSSYFEWTRILNTRSCVDDHFYNYKTKRYFAHITIFKCKQTCLINLAKIKICCLILSTFSIILYANNNKILFPPITT